MLERYSSSVWKHYRGNFGCSFILLKKDVFFFILFRNPNLPEKRDNSVVPEWPAFDARGQKYLELSPTMSPRSIKHHLAAPRIAFWEKLAPTLKSCDTNRADILTFMAVSYTTCLFLLKLMLWEIKVHFKTVLMLCRVIFISDLNQTGRFISQTMFDHLI